MTAQPAPIGIVGAGSVAQSLGRLLYEQGEPVVAVASRTPSNAERAARFIGPTVRAVGWTDFVGEVTRVLIATSDAAITSVAETLVSAGLRSGVALHTCGAKGSDALAPLRRVGVACGVFHPFQTVASPEQGVDDLRGVTYGVDGDAPALQWARQIAALLGGRAVGISPDRMPFYHAAAVMAGNGLTALLDAAIILLERAGFDRDVALETIEPLCRTTLENVRRSGPAAALTGPIARGDAATVKAHLDALSAAAPELIPLYEAIGRRLLDLARRRGLPDASVDALGAALETCRTGDVNGR